MFSSLYFKVNTIDFNLTAFCQMNKDIYPNNHKCVIIRIISGTYS